ncbi:hypothetical protein C27AD_17286 [Salinisphaera hydrothermalis C27AD]
MDEPVPPVEPELSPLEELPEPLDEDLEPDDERFVAVDLAVDDFDRLEVDLAPDVRFLVPVVLLVELALRVDLPVPELLVLARFELVFLGELLRVEVLVVDVLPEAARDEEDFEVDAFDVPDFVLLLARDFEVPVEVLDLVLPLALDDLAEPPERAPVLARVVLVRFLAVEPPLVLAVPLLALDELLLVAGGVVLAGTASAASCAASRTLEAVCSTACSAVFSALSAWRVTSARAFSAARAAASWAASLICSTRVSVPPRLSRIWVETSRRVFSRIDRL